MQIPRFFPGSTLCILTYIITYFSEYEIAFEKFAVDGLLSYNDIKEYFKSVGHMPSQKEIDEAIEIVTKCTLKTSIQAAFYIFSKLSNMHLLSKMD
jgi:Ca2+-binding EF-hand superfamily protein